MTSAGKLEMALADCAYLFEELQDVVALHRLSPSARVTA
jgi:hypothetical protein